MRQKTIESLSPDGDGQKVWRDLDVDADDLQIIVVVVGIARQRGEFQCGVLNHVRPVVGGVAINCEIKEK